MKALLTYSYASGHRKVEKAIAFLQKRLSKVFDTLDVVCSKSKEEAFEIERHAGEKYDVLLVCGGDGTANNAINALMNAEKRPIFGFFNFGTIGDFGKSFGIKKSLRRQVRVVEKGNVSFFDVGKLITKEKTIYFGYCAGVGAYTDVSYAVKRDKKKRFGRMAYYWKAFKESFGHQKVHYRYKGNKEVEQDSPFVICLAGQYIGGFKINFLAKTNDGKMEIFLTNKGLFNGLVSMLRKVRKPDDIISECTLDLDEDVIWCVDGEEGPKGSAKIEIVSKPLRIFCTKK